MKLCVAILPVTAFAQNCTLLWDEDTKVGAVCDPGGDIDKILALIKQQGLTIEKILITHGHVDHCGGAQALKDKLGVPIEGPQREDQFWIDRVADSAANYGLTGGPYVPDRWLEDGDTVSFGTTTLEVLHCPGHTPGHVVFFDRDSGLALVGDVIFQNSIGRTDFPRGDHGTLLSSIKDKLFPLGDDVTFIPGHGPTSTFGEERAHNPFLSGRFG